MAWLVVSGEGGRGRQRGEDASERGTHLDRLLDGRVGVHAMLVVQVDAVRAQALQAGLAGLLDVLGASVHDHLAVLELVGELGRQEDLVAAARLLEPPAEELLVREGPVDVRRVPEGDAQVRGPRQHLERLLVVLPAEGRVRERHAHAAEALGGDELIAEFALGILGHGRLWRGSVSTLSG